MAVHQVARAHGQAPAQVREWAWRDVVRAQALVRAEGEAQEAVQRHNESRRGVS